MTLIIYSILLALEVLVIAVLVSNAIPITPNPIVHTILARYQADLFFKRDIQLYALFLCISFVIYAIMLNLNRKNEGNVSWNQKLVQLTWAQGCWVFLQFYAAFKIIMDHSPLWATEILYSSLIASFLTKIFWPEFSAFVKKASPRAQIWVSSTFCGWRGSALACFFIFLVIYIPDPQAVVAQFYMGDQFHDWDVSIVGPVYGVFCGLIPDVDVHSQYGLGISELMAGAMKLLGGFDYVNVLKACVCLGILYFSVWFFILRRWFSSGLLAFAAIMLGLRVQMFDSGYIPDSWVGIAESVLRNFFDCLFFWSLYQHLKTQQKNYLWGAAGAAAAGVFCMISTGLGLVFSLGAYIGIHAIVPQIRKKMFRSPSDYLFFLRIILFIPLFMLLLVWLSVKGNIFNQVFWNNFIELHVLALSGKISGDLTKALHSKDFMFVGVGLSYVLVYLWSILYAVHLIYFKKADVKVILAIPLAVYGLCLHLYYIQECQGYSNVSLPVVFLLFFWLDYWCQWLPIIRQKQTRIAAVVVAVFALISAPMFTAYPNLLNLSPNPIIDPNVTMKLDSGGYYFNQLYIDFPDYLKLPLNSLGEKDEGLKFEKDFHSDKELIEYYKQDTDFSIDTAMIRRLTPEGSRVPLISSFEILFLSEAKRKPFFYYFPYLSSRQLRSRSFVTSNILTYTQINKMIGQLEKDKPPYVFMQRIFLTEQVPQWYFWQFEDCIKLIQYVKEHYQPQESGQYLMAMKLWK